jgi:Co/Zn/Cd efflux system component
MSVECCAPPSSDDPRFRRALWVALAINGAMFAIEIMSGFEAHSTALLADAVDFLGDAANYAISLIVLPLGMLWRTRAAMLKGASMTVYGSAVLAYAAYSAWQGLLPHSETMGIVGGLALAANIFCAVMLYRFRSGDSNMRSVWLCSRNDAIGNLAVLLAALGVFGTGSGWPDYIVAAIMASLAISAGISVLRHAGEEIRQHRH